MTSENILNNYIEKLIEKNEKLLEILNYTKSKNFKHSEEEVENITLYSRKRKRLFSELDNIISEIKKIEALEEVAQFISNEKVLEINESSKDTIRQIIKLDEANQIIFNKIHSSAKENIKNTKNSMKINNKYSGVYDSNFIGVNFDSSR